MSLRLAKASCITTICRWLSASAPIDVVCQESTNSRADMSPTAFEKRAIGVFGRSDASPARTFPQGLSQNPVVRQCWLYRPERKEDGRPRRMQKRQLSLPTMVRTRAFFRLRSELNACSQAIVGASVSRRGCRGHQTRPELNERGRNPKEGA